MDTFILGKLEEAFKEYELHIVRKESVSRPLGRKSRPGSNPPVFYVRQGTGCTIAFIPIGKEDSIYLTTSERQNWEKIIKEIVNETGIRINIFCGYPQEYRAYLKEQFKGTRRKPGWVKAIVESSDPEIL